MSGSPTKVWASCSLAVAVTVSPGRIVPHCQDSRPLEPSRTSGVGRPGRVIVTLQPPGSLDSPPMPAGCVAEWVQVTAPAF